jgi:hypothetical protein
MVPASQCEYSGAHAGGRQGNRYSMPDDGSAGDLRQEPLNNSGMGLANEGARLEPPFISKLDPTDIYPVVWRLTLR